MNIALERTHGIFLIVADDGRDRLIQLDWDYPGVAESFGWSIGKIQAHCHHNASTEECCPCPNDCEFACDHSGTDGTVRCDECGLTATDFINAAREWLDDNIGAVAADPGYFDGD